MVTWLVDSPRQGEFLQPAGRTVGQQIDRTVGTESLIVARGRGTGEELRAVGVQAGAYPRQPICREEEQRKIVDRFLSGLGLLWQLNSSLPEGRELTANVGTPSTNEREPSDGGAWSMTAGLLVVRARFEDRQALGRREDARRGHDAG